MYVLIEHFTSVLWTWEIKCPRFVASEREYAPTKYYWGIQVLIVFESYSRVYTGTTNILNRRSISSIALREYKEYGGNFLMSLYTRKYIHNNNWVKLPIDDEFVKRVEEIEKNWKTTHIWPISNIWVGTRNTHFGWHDRKWRRRIWRRKPIRWARRISCRRDFWRIRHGRGCTWRIPNTIKIW